MALVKSRGWKCWPFGPPVGANWRLGSIPLTGCAGPPDVCSPEPKAENWLRGLAAADTDRLVRRGGMTAIPPQYRWRSENGVFSRDCKRLWAALYNN